MKKNSTIIDLTLENRRIGINYDAKDEKTIEFFKVVQNKLLGLSAGKQQPNWCSNTLVNDLSVGFTGRN
jgi:hypothetical protein